MKRFLVGLSGQTGAGKSVVSGFLKVEGFAVIDCDQISHEVILPGGAAERSVKEAFPNALESGRLSRKKLARLVFTDKEKLLLLNDTIFPFIRNEVFKRLSAMDEIVVLDAPTLFESGLSKECGFIVSVVAEQNVRKRRIMERDNVDETAAEQRMASQLTESYFRVHSDFVIANNDGLDSLRMQIKKVADKIRERSDGH